jgi:hypothetical protein
VDYDRAVADCDEAIRLDPKFVTVDMTVWNFQLLEYANRLSLLLLSLMMEWE